MSDIIGAGNISSAESFGEFDVRGPADQFDFGEVDAPNRFGTIEVPSRLGSVEAPNRFGRLEVEE